MPLNVLYQVTLLLHGFYNKGITFNYWGLSDAEATAYLLKPNVAYAATARMASKN
jgi:hypothetical protein